MPNRSSARNIILPILGIIIAAFIFILPNHDGSTSYDDIQSIIVSTPDRTPVELTDSKVKAAFLTWLSDFVPEENIGFVKESNSFISPEAEIQAVVKSSADAENGGAMFLYAVDSLIYYNGTAYEATVQDMDNFRAFSEMTPE